MSVFDDLITKLSEKNLSDEKVDEILNAGEMLAKTLGDNEDVQKGVAKLKEEALNKKRNKDIKQIDNPKDLNATMDDYLQKIEKDPSVINHAREAEMAYKMSELVSTGKMNTEEVLAFSEKLMKTGCMKSGSEVDKSFFENSIIKSFEYCGYQSEQQRKMGAIANQIRGASSEKYNLNTKSKGNINHNATAEKFKEGTQSFEAGSGVFDRFKKAFKDEWNSEKAEWKARKSEIKAEWNAIKGAVKTIVKIEENSISRGLEKNPKAAIWGSLGCVFAGMGTGDPALAAAGGVMLSASAMSLYNKKVKGNLKGNTAENTTAGEKPKPVNVQVLNQDKGR